MVCNGPTEFKSHAGFYPYHLLYDRSAIGVSATHLNIFSTGFLDSISVHKIFPLLVNNKEIAYLTFQIFGANSVLLVGSVTLYNYAILPGLSRLRSSIVFEISAVASQSDSTNYFGGITLAKVLFYCLFLIPSYILCYSCSAVWYQNLAECMHKMKKVGKATPLVKAVVDSTYATIAWFFLFLQVQLLLTIIPMLLSSTLSKEVETMSATERIFDIIFGTTGMSWYQGMIYFLHILICCGIIISRAVGLSLLSIMYGWYGFDPHWIAAGIDPDTRFGKIEKYWAYFLGFGAPYLILVKTTSFFVGYGWFLALFPFCIMLGGTCDYTAPYKSLPLSPAPLRVFKCAQIWTLSALKILGKSANLKSNESSASSLKKNK